MNTTPDLSQPLSDARMQQLIPSAKVIKYSDLKELLRGRRSIPLPLVLLYEVAPNQGHWVMVHETPEGIEHFDAYGYKPDQEFEFIDGKFRRKSGQAYPLLVKALLQAQKNGHIINYNQFELQSLKNGIATCGKWCALRWKFRRLSIKDFHALVGRVSKRLGISKDELVARSIS